MFSKNNLQTQPKGGTSVSAQFLSIFCACPTLPTSLPKGLFKLTQC